MLQCILNILGCWDDLKKATKTARSMVVDYGMSTLGLQYRYNSNESEQGKLRIGMEVDKILEDSHTRVTNILNEHREELDIISTALMSKKTLYAEEIKLLIENYHSKSLCDFTVFDAKMWPKDATALLGFGREQISRLSEYYHSHGHINSEEANGILDEFPIFCKMVSVTLNTARETPLHEFYGDMIKENQDDIKNVLLLVKIMMSIYASTASNERGFSALNNEKTVLRTSISEQT